MSAPGPWAEGAALASARDAARHAASVLGLPLRRQVWRGAAGPWTGAGRGTSVEFQDHRPYVPGDDPRRVDWSAFARSGQLSMKLFREEVSPAVDVVVDASRSMHADPGKRARVVELLLFALDAAEDAGAPVRVFWVAGERQGTLAAGDAREARLFRSADAEPERAEPDLRPLPLRTGSLRVLVSDGLFAAAPAACLRDLTARQGRAVMLCPYTAAEAEPDWAGSLEMVDAESGAVRAVRIDAGRLARYRESWQRHFETWRAECARHATAFAQVPCAPPLREALRAAVDLGALEPRA